MLVVERRNGKGTFGLFKILVSYSQFPCSVLCISYMKVIVNAHGS